MAKILNLEAPESMELRRMEPEEIEKYVANLAGEALEKIPDGVRPARVNAVALAQTVPAVEWEVWAEWTRACADQRTKIEDYTDPVLEEVERPGSPVADKWGSKVLKSELRIQEQLPGDGG